MKSFAFVVTLGAVVLLGGTAANANPVKAHAVTDAQWTDFSSQHRQRQGHNAQRVVRTQHGQPHRGQRRAPVHGGGHGGGSPGITIGVGGGAPGHR